MKKFRVSARAEIDLAEIRLFISQDSPQAATRLIDRFFKRFHFLGRFPKAGERQPRLGTGDLRNFSHGSYVIYYRIHASDVEIVRVVHGARDSAKLFKSLPE
jgi:toxin ParE1/3/4